MREPLRWYREWRFERSGGPNRCIGHPEYAKKVARTIVNNWKIAKAVAESRGAQFMAILQPVLPLGSPRRDHLLEPGKKIPPSMVATVYPFIRRIVADERLGWVHDFGDAYDGNEYIYTDWVHASENGNRIIAERIRDVLGERLPTRE